LYKVKEQYLICASPERYIQNTHNTIISQPIKGTIKRDITNKQHDEQLKLALRSNKKEISENVMVVDLVRNDLSKICEASTVTVPELMQVYTFPQLHHLISTIKGQLKERISFKQIIEATFPMGSMTGAPKHSVVQLINEFETGSRGIFAGTVGYISPNNHFDFNVIIRSILYNATSKYLSYWVGSGITIYSNPTDEYNECLLKAKAIEKTLS
jgi:para-aminobenzoate synthetase component 1